MDDSTGIVAIEGGIVVAAGRFGVPDQAETADIRDFAVAGSRQGNGLGRYMLGLLEERARAAGMQQMTVFSRISAQGFYRKLGYKLIKPMEFGKAL